MLTPLYIVSSRIVATELFHSSNLRFSGNIRILKQETAMFVVVRRRKLVKPCKPTPWHLRTYKISQIDEFNPSMYMPRILYYPFDEVKGRNICLEESLAQVLPQFYPLAGRYNKEKHEVNCNDEGAEYSVAEVDCELRQLLGPEEKIHHLVHLLPRGVCEADKPTDPMLAVQINRFRCGGLAVAVFAAHRIFDSASLSIFLKAWANAATNGGSVVTPYFDSPLHLPPGNLPSLQFQATRIRDKTIVARRFVFDKNAILGLRESLSNEWMSAGIEKPPSRVVIVSAVMTQALLRADRAKHGGKPRGSIILHEINVREWTVPPIPEHSSGTWASLSFTEFTAHESQNMEMIKNFPGIALKMRDTVVQWVKDFSGILNDKKFGRRVLVDSFIEAAHKADTHNHKVIWMTDWSKFGEYDLDFGFGKTAWVSLVEAPLKDLCIMMNTKDNDGIEAWMFLHETDMAYLEQDHYLRMLTNRLHSKI